MLDLHGIEKDSATSIERAANDCRPLSPAPFNSVLRTSAAGARGARSHTQYDSSLGLLCIGLNLTREKAVFVHRAQENSWTLIFGCGRLKSTGNRRRVSEPVKQKAQGSTAPPTP